MYVVPGAAVYLQSLQLAGLRVLSSLAAGVCEGEVLGEVLVTTQLLDRLLQLIRDTQTPQQVCMSAGQQQHIVLH